MQEISQIVSSIQTETDSAIQSINETSIEIDVSNSLSENTEKALAEIVSSTEKVVELVEQIAVANDEQSKTSDEISNSITEVSIFTKEAGGAVGEITIACQDLDIQITKLNENINVFKLN